MTRVVHCKREPYDVYIGRPSIWGNPFSHLPGKGEFLVATREEAIEAHRCWIREPAQRWLLARVGELRGKVLGCWCVTTCHGDTLSELADTDPDVTD